MNLARFMISFGVQYRRWRLPALVAACLLVIVLISNEYKRRGDLEFTNTKLQPEAIFAASENVERIVHIFYHRSVIPTRYKHGLDSWSHCIPKAQIYLWTPPEIRRFVAQDNDTVVRRLIRKQKPEHATVLGKLLILYRMGGIFADAAFVCRKDPFALLRGRIFVVAQEAWFYSQFVYGLDYLISLDLMISVPQSRFVEFVFEVAQKNTSRFSRLTPSFLSTSKRYGVAHARSLTSAVNAFADNDESSSIYIANYMELTPRISPSHVHHFNETCSTTAKRSEMEDNACYDFKEYMDLRRKSDFPSISYLDRLFVDDIVLTDSNTLRGSVILKNYFTAKKEELNV